MRNNLRFEERFTREGDIATVTIKDIDLPRIGNFDPCGTIWSRIKKRYRDPKKGGIDVAGIFDYRDTDQIITCTFYLSYANVPKKEALLHQSRFHGLRQLMLTDFEEYLDSFMQDEALDKYSLIFKEYKEACGQTANYIEQLKIADAYYESAEKIFKQFMQKVGCH